MGGEESSRHVVWPHAPSPAGPAPCSAWHAGRRQGRQPQGSCRACEGWAARAQHAWPFPPLPLAYAQLVFGDQKAAYLLPWRRLFNITDAQVFVARRDNARSIFRTYLEQQGGDLPADRCATARHAQHTQHTGVLPSSSRRGGSSLPASTAALRGAARAPGCERVRPRVRAPAWQPRRHFLRQLREQQQAVKMLDETAVEVVREAARKHAEALLEKAIAVLKATGEPSPPPPLHSAPLDST